MRKEQSEVLKKAERAEKEVGLGCSWECGLLGVDPLNYADVRCSPHPARCPAALACQQLAALRATAEKKALLATAARAVVSAAQQAQRDGRLLTNQEIAAIKYVANRQAADVM